MTRPNVLPASSESPPANWISPRMIRTHPSVLRLVRMYLRSSVKCSRCRGRRRRTSHPVPPWVDRSPAIRDQRLGSAITSIRWSPSDASATLAGAPGRRVGSAGPVAGTRKPGGPDGKTVAGRSDGAVGARAGRRARGGVPRRSRSARSIRRRRRWRSRSSRSRARSATRCARPSWSTTRRSGRARAPTSRWRPTTRSRTRSRGASRGGCSSARPPSRVGARRSASGSGACGCSASASGCVGTA